MLRLLILVVFCLTVTACGQGPQGVAGLTGTIGPQGSSGSQGEPGQDGLNATPVAMIQLCPGYPTVYPSSFPEYAMCVQHKLYGVYNDGVHPLAFLAELPPGNYASVAPQGCNLRIHGDCQVERL